MSRLEQRLASGGYRTATAAVVYSIAGLVIPVMFALVALRGFGFTTPQRLDGRGRRRRRRYLVPRLFLTTGSPSAGDRSVTGFPMLLDLLIVCLEAGSSLDQSVIKASQELAIAYPALAEELQVLTTETRGGQAQDGSLQEPGPADQGGRRPGIGGDARTDRSLRDERGAGAENHGRRHENEAAAGSRGNGGQGWRETSVSPRALPVPALFVVILGPAIIRFSEAFQR